MTTEVSTILALIVVVAIAVAGIGAWWINRTPTSHRDERETLPLFTGMGPSTAANGAKPPASTAPVVSITAVPIAASPRVPRPTIREFTTTSARPVTTSPVTPTPVTPTPVTPTPVTSANAPVLSDAGVPGTMVEGHAIRFSVPADGTLQFLPGRLEIGSGFDAGREIRFVHVPGPDGTEVTFGRTEGALYRHIQLRDKTVSRQHALLQWRDGHWYLRNLSHTNPVARNGVVLDTIDAPCLQDGDRLEMGEVLFTFWSR